MCVTTMEGRRMHKKSIFIIIAIIIFSCITVVFIPHYSNYSNYIGFYDEKNNLDDVVVIGSSNAYAFLCPPIMYKYHGVAAYNFSTDSMPFEIVEEVIKEARKRQPDATYLVVISDVDKSMGVERMHWTFDYMKFGANKVKAVNKCLNRMEWSPLEGLEFFFPIIRYHSDWENLNKDSFDLSIKSPKGALVSKKLIFTSVDIADEYVYEEECLNISDYGMECLDSLLDYVDSNDVNIVFAIVPQADIGEQQGRINTMQKYIEEHGYEVLDYRKYIDEIGLDLQKDYYDVHHINCHGTIKFSEYVAKDLIEKNYATDRRGDSRYSEWEDAFEEYYNLVSQEVTDEEWNMNSDN